MSKYFSSIVVPFQEFHSSSESGSYLVLELILVDDEAFVDVFELDIIDADVTFMEFAAAVEEGREVVADAVEVIWFGAGEAVLWLDTESGLTDSSITISPGDPGESGGNSFAQLDDTCGLRQGFFEWFSSWPCNGRFTPEAAWVDPVFGALALLLVDPEEPSPFVISSTILFLT